MLVQRFSHRIQVIAAACERRRREVDGTDSGACPVADFVISRPTKDRRFHRGRSWMRWLWGSSILFFSTEKWHKSEARYSFPSSYKIKNTLSFTSDPIVWLQRATLTHEMLFYWWIVRHVYGLTPGIDTGNSFLQLICRNILTMWQYQSLELYRWIRIQI